MAGFLLMEGGEEFGDRNIKIWRVSRSIAQAFSQESREERCVEHGSSQALVRFEERAAAHGKEEICATYQATTEHSRQ